MSFKLDFYKQTYPDALQYLESSESFVTENEAKAIVYKQPNVNAKLLFKNIIERPGKSLQQYIFSEKAFQIDKAAAERSEVHGQQLLEPYH